MVCPVKIASPHRPKRNLYQIMNVIVAIVFFVCILATVLRAITDVESETTKPPDRSTVGCKSAIRPKTN